MSRGESMRVEQMDGWRQERPWEERRDGMPRVHLQRNAKTEANTK